MRLIVLLALAAAPLPACAPAISGGTSQPTPAAAAPLLRLEDRREYDPAVFQALTSPSAPLRRRAALAAARIRDPRSIVPLGALLNDADTAVAATAAFALGQIGPAAVEAAAALRTATLTDADAGVRRAATSALGRIGPAAVPVLVAALSDTEKGVRQAAATALEEIGPAAVPALAAAIYGAEVAVREAAARVLERISSAPA